MWLLLFWIPLSYIVIYAGGRRRIGSVKTFWLTFFLTPIIGLIAVLLSEKLPTKAIDYYSELLKLSQLREKNLISIEEFELQKAMYQAQQQQGIPKPETKGMWYYTIAILAVVTLMFGLTTYWANKYHEEFKQYKNNNIYQSY